MTNQQPIAISAGDPCGVGPNVSIVAAHRARAHVRSVIFGDLAQLLAVAERLGYERTAFIECDEGSLGALGLDRVGLVDTGRIAPALIARHAASLECGEAQLRCLQRAATSVLCGQTRALVTGPTNKAAISSAGVSFVGQTEFLARLDGREEDAVTMLFLGPRLRVALVSTHLAISAVPAAITEVRVARTIRHLSDALRRYDPDRSRRLVIAGLNPHAGEDGLFGREELDVIARAVETLRRQEPFVSGAASLTGPAPAESAFRAAQRGDEDGVVAMFHDQATIASKLLDWGAAVNTTWGLSFLRTSVDHGVAYQAAREGNPDAGGMSAALAAAVALS